MRKIHLDQCNSTQSYLKECFEKGDIVDLVTTDKQLSGKGRGDSIWDHHSGTYCFSFLSKYNEIKTMTSLEVGVLLLKFLNQFTDKKLYNKWPNDILDHNFNKLSGILITGLDNEHIVIGIGVNLLPSGVQTSYPKGALFSKENEQYQQLSQDFGEQFYQFFQQERLSAVQVKKLFMAQCAQIGRDCIHQNQNYIFSGIGNNGQAILQSVDNSNTYEVFSGEIQTKFE